MRRPLLRLIIGCSLACTLASKAEVKMPAIFGDHMVMQQDRKIPVWGTADSAEAVSVTLGSATVQTQADADGNWRVDLPPVSTNAAPQTLTVKGSNTLTFQDVLVGDVWLAGGQSNMEFKMVSGPGNGQGALNAREALATAANPQLRLFTVAHQTAVQPKKDLQGTWVVASPETVATFSAVAYFFGLNLQQSLHRPIGMIGAYWGGTPGQSWATFETMKTVPLLKAYNQTVQSEIDHYPKTPADIAAAAAAFAEKEKAWQTDVNAPFQAALKLWKTDLAAATASGQPAPPMPKRVGPQEPISPDGEAHQPSILFNGMIAPLIPYGIKGAIWYQGESNVAHWPAYPAIFQGVIGDWRAQWGEGDFPFLFVQLANYLDRKPDPGESDNAHLREVQLQTLALPNTGMAVAIDLGLAKNIHPRDKLDVGRRLALAAKHVAYGQDLVYSGPVYSKIAVSGSKVTVSFTNIGSGLIIGQPPAYPSDSPPPSTTELDGFAIAGADRKWVWAQAQIVGDDVVVSSDQVAEPVAVRYGWADNPAVNLYNKENLPASPFRTDDW